MTRVSHCFCLVYSGGHCVKVWIAKVAWGAYGVSVRRPTVSLVNKNHNVMAGPFVYYVVDLWTDERIRDLCVLRGGKGHACGEHAPVHDTVVVSY